MLCCAVMSCHIMLCAVMSCHVYNYVCMHICLDICKYMANPGWRVMVGKGRSNGSCTCTHW